MRRLDAAREAFAEQLRREGPLRSERLVRAFARVPREDFLPPGPWLTLPDERGYRSTPSADPEHLYADVAVALDAARLLNNGAPGFVGRILDGLDPRPGERVLHLGSGPGYYTAILAELVGGAGHVLAVELDPELARQAQRALRSWRNVEVIHGDGLEQPEPSQAVDVIFVHGGVSHATARWLDALPVGGRLALALTAVRPTTRVRRFLRDHAGRVLQVRREPGGFSARFGEACGIQALLGGRDPEHQRALAEAFGRGRTAELRSLRRDAHAPDASCWLHGGGYCLSTRTVGGTT